ncbi:MAG: hypothetical protein WCK85_11085 [Chlorobium sp.]
MTALSGKVHKTFLEEKILMCGFVNVTGLELPRGVETGKQQ